MKNDCVKGGNSIKVLFKKLIKSNGFIYWLFIFLIVLVEAIFTFMSIYIGVIIYLAILISLLIAALMKYQESCYQVFSALALIPLIRIINVSLPMTGLSELFRIVSISVPLFITGVIIAKIVSITPKALGIRINKLHKQLLISLIGLPLGFIKFYIIQPKLKDISAVPVEILWAIILIVCVSLLEEFLFRGILFNTANRFLSNNKAMYFTSLLYATLAISLKSLLNVIYALLISILFCRIFIWKKSIVGISLAHGMINITFYLICPQIF